MPLPDGSCIAVVDPGVGQRVKQDGHHPLDLWSYLSAIDIRNAYARLRTVSNRWWQPFLGHIEHKGIHLADACHRDMWYPLCGMILAGQVVRRAIRDVSPDVVVACRPRGQAVFWDSIPVPPGCIPAAATIFEAEQLGVPLELAETGNPVITLSPATPHPELLEWLKQELLAAQGKDAICFFLGELEYRQHTAILETLGNRNNQFPFWLKASGQYAVDDRDASGANWYDLLSCFPGDPALKDLLNVAWQEFINHDRPDAFDIIGSPHVRFQFTGFWDRVLLCGRIVDAASWLFERLKPKLCLQGLDAYGPARTWGRVARKHGAHTVTFLHGAISPNCHQYERLQSEADLLVVEGDTAREAMITLNRSPETIHTHRPGMTSISQEMGGTNILLLTALASYSLYSPVYSPERMWRDWMELTAMIARHPKWAFLIKPHPRYDHFDFFEELALPGNCCFNRDISLDEALSKARVAVMIGYPSSVILDSLKQGIPSVFLPGTWPIPELRSALDSERIIKSTDVGGLEKTLEVLLHPGPERNRAIENGFAFLNDFYGKDNPGSPSLKERIETLFSGEDIQQPKDIA